MKTRVDKRSHDRPSLEPATRSSTLQSKAASGPRQQQQQQHIAQLLQNVPNANRTGLPDTLKSGIEALSGMDMSGVGVHRNSDKPAALQAHAYAQGSDIHLGPGQEKHLPHEAWHVVQQAQGRVRPTTQMKGGAAVNDEAGLEREADQMGAKALAATTQFAAKNTEASHPRLQMHTFSAHPIQRVSVQDSDTGKLHETIWMSDEEITALALRFYELHNIGELRKIQAAHPRLPITDSQLYQLKYGEAHPRTTKRHEDSEGESENDDPMVAHRSLRIDEDSPQTLGLSAPLNHDPTITARAHINSGSRAKQKSRFISASRSIKKAGAWASTNTVDEDVGRVASFDIPYNAMGGGIEPVDVTRKQVQKDLFPNGGSALNSAKASQEVLVPDRVPPEYIRSIYEAMPLSPKAYRRKKVSGAKRRSKLLRGRSKVSQKPQAFELIEIYNREQSSERRLRDARAHWDESITDMVEQTNAQFSGVSGFEDVDEDDVAEFLQEHTQNPHTLDYVSNELELQLYLTEINQALQAYASSCAVRFRS